MKCVLVIFLSLSVYSPDIARFVAYADLFIDVVTENKVNICDCEDILQQNEKPSDHQEQMTVLKTEFKYLVTELAAIPLNIENVIQTNRVEITCKLPCFSHDIFQPPKV